MSGVIITPTTMNAMCDAIAHALAEAFPHNTWMVLPDHEALPLGGYGFVVMTRHAGAKPLDWDYAQHSVLLDEDHAAPTRNHCITSRPRVNDFLKGMDHVCAVLIPGLIKNLTGLDGVWNAPLPPPEVWRVVEADGIQVEVDPHTSEQEVTKLEGLLESQAPVIAVNYRARVRRLPDGVNVRLHSVPGVSWDYLRSLMERWTSMDPTDLQFEVSGR